MRLSNVTIFALIALSAPALYADSKPVPKTTAATMAEVLAASKPSDWRPLDPQNTLYMELPAGRVIIELAPVFAPKHAQNIKALVREGYFDGLAILRSQENYVVQWGDPSDDDEANQSKAREVRTAQKKLPAEFTVALSPEIPFTRLPDADGYAPQVGFSDGFASARDPKTGQAWLCHCNGAIGVARGNEADSGGGTSLYAVIGHAPRNLDRNIAVVGRVMKGMELLSTMPRGTGNMGFYEKPEQMTLIKSVKVAADVPEAERTPIEVLRTDTKTFTDLVETRRNRREEWYKYSAGYVEVCNVPIVTRPTPK